jgi:hypothetical protein
METPTFSPCLKGNKKKEGWMVPSKLDLNQLLGSIVKAYFPQIQYSPIGTCSQIIPGYCKLRNVS